MAKVKKRPSPPRLAKKNSVIKVKKIPTLKTARVGITKIKKVPAIDNDTVQKTPQDSLKSVGVSLKNVKHVSFTTKEKQTMSPNTLSGPSNKLRKCVVNVRRCNSEAHLVPAALICDVAALDKNTKSPIEVAANATKKIKLNDKKDENNLQQHQRNHPAKLSKSIVRLRRTHMLHSSTPIKDASAKPTARQPFRELNLQHVNETAAHTNEKVEKSIIITKQMRADLKKLSLSKSIRRRKSQDTNDNEISRFEPTKNSTLYGYGFTKTTRDDNEIAVRLTREITEKVDVEITKNAKAGDGNKSNNSRTHHSSENLANKTDVIEQLLLTDDEAQSTPPAVQLAANKTHKFFHRDLQAAQDVAAVTKNGDKHQEQQKSEKPFVKPTKIQKPRQGLKRKSRRSNVYEFLSQTSESDSGAAHKDPAADVIKKLIAGGRVRLVTRQKGTGKMVIKRKKNVPQNKNKKVPNKRAKKNEAATTTTHAKELRNKDTEVNAVDNDDVHDADNDVDDFDYADDVEVFEPPLHNDDIVTVANKSNAHHHVSFSSETFSNLARSVLISQSGKNLKLQKRLSEQRKLLDIARKFVSTPVNKNALPSALEKSTNFSPINGTKTVRPQLGCSSPWRVDEEAHLPNVFYFSRNSANLPSFSSDFIPSTPRKERPSIANDTLNASSANNSNGNVSLPTITAAAGLPTDSLSSFSSNDSNAENMPPPHVTAATPHTDIGENEAALNKRQQTNPRRALSCRSPLKAINILEVITIPPWKSPAKAQNAQQKDATSPPKTYANERRTRKLANVSNLFGFDEFLVDDEANETDLEEVTVIDANDAVCNNSLRDKLHDLMHLRPANCELPKVSAKPIRAVFDTDAELKDQQQLDIRTMLCSTMINPSTARHNNDGPSKGAGVGGGMHATQSLILDDDGTNTTQEFSQLFKDTEPEVTLDDKNLHRTYVRPYKRKRKLRHNFVMFMDSDESGEESHDEHDASSETEVVAPKKKRNKKCAKPNVELNSFVQEFNEMVKEVEQYELVVE